MDMEIVYFESPEYLSHLRPVRMRINVLEMGGEEMSKYVCIRSTYEASISDYFISEGEITEAKT